MTDRTDGIAKAALARDHVRCRNPWTDLAALCTDLDALTPGHFADLDCLVLAVDNERARYHAARLGLAARVPLVDAAVRADLFTTRVTVTAPGPEHPCLVDGWTDEHLARAGEDVGVPCAGLDNGPPYGSTLSMAQAGAALAIHQVLALTGVTDEPAWVGHELRLDLHAGRLDRFIRPPVEGCAADHVLGAAAPVLLGSTPADTSLGALMDACGAGPDAVVVFATAAVVTTALCPACSRHLRPCRPLPLDPCRGCGAPPAPLRRSRRVRWGDVAPVVATAAADTWFRAGDRFAILDGATARTFSFAPPAVAWEAGRPLEEAEVAARFTRLPRRYDLTRIRRTRLGLVGLGHLGAAILEGLAPLPWAGLLLADRDQIAVHNLAAYALAASAAGGAPS